MAIVTMPRAGQSMEEGTILRWCRQEGEPVREGEVLLEIDTDKATVEVEAAESGILRRILVPAGETVPVLSPIGIIAGESSDITGLEASARAQLRLAPAAVAASGAVAVDSVTAVSGAVAEAPLRASPAARKEAQARGVDLATVGPGSGPAGRILSTDVARAALQAASPSRATVPEAGAVRRPLAGMRRAIARGMAGSKQSIPHFYARLTIDAGPLLSWYREQKQKHPCTINDVVTLACARAIREFPAFRSRIEGEEVVEYPAASIGIAVGMDDGLLVPVIVGADGMSFSRLATESRRVVEAAKQGKVTAMGQGVFTISNLGGYGVEEFTAIINPPESAILAVGAVREAVIVREEAMRPGRVMTLTLSADHRLIDGLLAARFLRRLKELLESPSSLG